eukprot:Nk52_evm22s246 gene=Nk52_evmTU22s246
MAVVDSSYQATIGSLLSEAHQPVTYRVVSQKCHVDVNTAKKMLYAFAVTKNPYLRDLCKAASKYCQDEEKQQKADWKVGSNNPDENSSASAYATFIVMGRHGGSDQSLKVVLVGQDKLQSVVESFSKVSSVHLYSVHLAKPKDRLGLYNKQDGILDVNEKWSLEEFNKHKVIQPPRVYKTSKSNHSSEGEALRFDPSKSSFPDPAKLAATRNNKSVLPPTTFHGSSSGSSSKKKTSSELSSRNMMSQWLVKKPFKDSKKNNQKGAGTKKKSSSSMEAKGGLKNYFQKSSNAVTSSTPSAAKVSSNIISSKSTKSSESTTTVENASKPAPKPLNDGDILKAIASGEEDEEDDFSDNEEEMDRALCGVDLEEIEMQAREAKKEKSPSKGVKRRKEIDDNGNVEEVALPSRSDTASLGASKVRKDCDLKQTSLCFEKQDEEEKEEEPKEVAEPIQQYSNSKGYMVTEIKSGPRTAPPKSSEEPIRMKRPSIFDKIDQGSSKTFPSKTKEKKSSQQSISSFFKKN